MTTKTITSNYYAGYTVGAGVTALYAEALISGANGGVGNLSAGGAGGVGLTSAHGAYVKNTGVITGGLGGVGGVGASGASAGVAGSTGYGGGAGGVGVALTGGSITNTQQIFGGAGGKGGQGGAGGSGAKGGVGGDGGAGGAGVTLSGAMLTNLYFIVGGAGGAGGAGGHGGVGGGNGGVGSGGKSGDGVVVAGGGTVVNGSSTDGKATIQGDSGVRNAGGGVMSVTNYGAITGTTGVSLGNGDSLANKAGATISGSYAAVFVGDPSTIFNDGTLQQSGGGNYYGVAGFGGVLVNGGSSDSSALIAGNIGVGDTAPAGLTVTNYATISGTTDAVKFNEVADRLIAEAGSTFIGAVEGGGGTLELANGTGTITGLGGTGTISGAEAMTISGFGAYVLDKGSSWTSTGTNNDAGAQLTVAGSLHNTGQLDSHVIDQGGAIGNDGTVKSTGSGVAMVGGGLTNGGAADTTALVTGGAYGVYAGPSAMATIVNYASITSTGSGSGTSGVWLSGGGSLVNGGSSDSTALIKGVRGLFSQTSAATLTNYGTVDGTGGVAVLFANAGDRLIAEAGSTFIGAVKGGGGTLELANGTGTITGLGATGTVSGPEAITFSGFGSYVVDTGSAWTLAGADTIAGGKTLTNNGTVGVTGSLVNIGEIVGRSTGKTTVGVSVAPGGSLTNQAKGVITGYYGVSATAASVTNFGTIKSSSTATLAAGVSMAGGTLTNGSLSDKTALIQGSYAVYGTTAASVGVVNYGTIAGTASAGPSPTGVFFSGGSLQNGAATDRAALVEGVAWGVYARAGHALTVTNFGTLEGSQDSVDFNSSSDRLIAEAGSTFKGAVAGGGGTLELANGTGTITGLGATGTISGAEAMTFSGFGSYVIDTGSAWTLAGAETIVGGDTLTNNGTASVTGALVNQGAINGGSAGPSTVGVSVAKGGSLTNQTKGVIAGYYGVSATGASVTNFGTIKSNSNKRFAAGVSMAGGTLTNGSLSDETALIEGGYAVDATASARVVNYGTIAGNASGGLPRGVRLIGGSLVNGAASDSAALVEGNLYGVYAAAAATVTNFGTLEGGNRSVFFVSSSDRLIAEAGSTFGGLAAGGGGALELATGTGTITGIGATGTITGDIAMTFSGFGSYVLDKGSSWTLGGTETLAAGQTLTNAGTANATGALNVAGSLVNIGQINGNVASANGTITNLGAMTNGVGMNGGRLTNGSAADTSALVGSAAYAVYANTSGPATVANFGTIKSSGGGGLDCGVWLNGGGLLTNGGATDSKALIEGFTGAQNFGSAMTVTNFGVIDGTGGVALHLGASSDRLIDEAGSTLIGVAEGGGGTLELAKGTGTIAGLGTSFTGFGQYRVDSGGTWTMSGANTLAAGDTLTNAGVLTVTGSLANLGRIVGELKCNDGTIANGSAADMTASITGASDGVYLYGPQAVSVTNFGAIVGTTNIGVRMQYEGSLTNGSASDTGALVSGGATGFYADFPSTVTNFGSIIGKSAQGVRLRSGALINGSAKDAKAMISGGAQGVYVNGAATVTNYGVIKGALSVEFKSAADRLIDEAGSTLTGVAQGGGGTLELAKGTGTVSGLGKAFTGFATYQVDAGGTWTLSGTNTIAAGTTLTDKGTLIDTGPLSLAAGAKVTIADAAVLQIEGAVSNAGTITVAGATHNTNLVIEAAGATLSGKGAVTLVGAAHARLIGANSSAVLTNLDNTIAGAGSIIQMSLKNDAAGVIDASAKGGLDINLAGKTLTNHGLVEASGAGQLTINSTVLDDSSGGTLEAAGARVYIQNAHVIGGALTATGVGVFIGIGTTDVIDGTAGHAVTLSGRFIVADKSTVTLEGAFINKGTLLVGSTANVTDLAIGAGGATLSGGGFVVMNNHSTDHIDAAAAATLTNVDNRIIGAGTIGNANLTIVNDVAGLISSTGSAALTIDTGANTIANAGFIEAAGKGGVTVKSAIANTGVLYADKGALTVNGAVTGSGRAQILGATLAFTSSFTENVTFVGTSPTGVLQLAQSVNYTGTITGLSHTANATKLDLRDIAFLNGSTKATATWSQSTGVLTVTNGAKNAHIHLAGAYTGSSFTTADDGHGGVFVTDPPPPPPAAPHPALKPQSTHPFVAAISGFGSGPAHAPSLAAPPNEHAFPLLLSARTAAFA